MELTNAEPITTSPVVNVDKSRVVPNELRQELEKPTVANLADLDFYKLTMAQVAWKRHRDVPVAYEFINRHKEIRLADAIPQEILQEHLERIQKMRFTNEQIQFLNDVRINNQKIFDGAFLDSLRDMELPDFELSQRDGQFQIKVKGPWSTAIYWETLILSTVNELYYRVESFESGKSREQILEEGRHLLAEKIERLQRYVQSQQKQGFEGPKIIDFGTRRRYAYEWQKEVLTTMANALPEHFVGTSNVEFGRLLNLPIKGTFAHEMDMIYSGIYYTTDEEAQTFESHTMMLNDWSDEFGGQLTIALTDTYGHDFFFKHFTPEQAKNWGGLRHDSGNPIEFGEKAISFYEEHGIDPKGKVLVFSDGLTVDAIIDIYEHFKGKIQMVFGWGTTLTNDMGFPTMSIVFKATEAAGHPVVKLSDNIAKGTGDPLHLDRARVFSGNQGAYNKRPDV